MTAVAGTVELVRLALRRDRLLLPAWVAGLSLLVLATAEAFDRVYPGVEQRQALAAGVATNPGLRAVTGPPFDLATTGGLTAWRITGPVCVLMGVMSLLIVVRHTRSEEETGRAELIGAGAVGRYAGIVAGMLVAIGANIAVSVLVIGGLLGLGLPVAGSVALGLMLGATGIVFAAIAAVTAQVADTGRGAAGAAGSLVGLAFLLRAIGDVGTSTLSWLSPIGWAQRARPYADERWWTLLLPLVLALVVAGLAFGLAARRDLGMGMLPARSGRRDGSRWLAGPVGLAWRLQRMPLLAWTAGFATIGAMVGLIGESVTDLLDQSPQIAELMRTLGGGVDIVGSLFATFFGMLGIVAAGYVAQATLRIRGEELASRADPVLAGSTPRWRWAGGHLLCAAGGVVLILTVAGLSAGLVHGSRSGELDRWLPDLLGAGLARVPAALVFGGLAAVLVGFAPRLTALVWAALAVCLGLDIVGPLLGLPDWVLAVSPFDHTPMLPMVDISFTPLAVLASVAVGSALVGLAALRRRDIG